MPEQVRTDGKGEREGAPEKPKGVLFLPTLLFLNSFVLDRFAGTKRVRNLYWGGWGALAQTPKEARRPLLLGRREVQYKKSEPSRVGRVSDRREDGRRGG